MVTISFVLRLVAVLCFLLRLFGVGGPVDLVVAGLALWCLSTLVP